MLEAEWAVSEGGVHWLECLFLAYTLKYETYETFRDSLCWRQNGRYLRGGCICLNVCSSHVYLHIKHMKPFVTPYVGGRISGI